MYVYVHVYVHVYVCTYVCVPVCVFIHVCVCMQEHALNVVSFMTSETMLSFPDWMQGRYVG